MFVDHGRVTANHGVGEGILATRTGEGKTLPGGVRESVSKKLISPPYRVRSQNECYDRTFNYFNEVKTMAWDGDALAGQMEEIFERQQSVADARAVRGAATSNERARSAEFESMRISRSRIMTQLNAATNPSHRAVLERALQS